MMWNYPKEHNLQKSIVRLLRLNQICCISGDVMDGLKFLGYDQSKRIAFINHHKQMGYIAGQPDLIIFIDGGKTFFVELKTEKGRQSREQKNFQTQVERLGFSYEIWRNITDCEEFIKKCKK